MEGYIKLWRSMLDWEHYTDIKTKTLFIHLFLTANFKDVKCMGQIVPRGSRIIKESRIGEECGLTYQEVRTALKRLIFTGEITKKTTNKFTLVSIENYEEYQSDLSTPNEQLTNKQRTNNEQITSIEEECKECKEYTLSSELSEPDKKKSIKLYKPDSREYLSAEYIAKRILKERPDYKELQGKKYEKALQRWADDIEKIFRIDKRDFEEFKDVLYFSQTDEFWKSNIMSGQKLRDKYDQLAIKMEEVEKKERWN